MPTTVSFGVFSDAHYGQTVVGDRICADSLAKVRACVDAFNARGLSLALNLGDLINGDGGREAALASLSRISKVCSLFRGEWRFLLGNHDVEALTKDEFVRNAGVDMSGPFYSFDHEGVHFVVLDGNCHEDGSDYSEGDFDWAVSWVSPAQLDWLAADLQSNRGRPAIVLCHENLDERTINGAWDPHVVRNAAAVRAVLARARNMAAVIEGHYHPGMHTVCDGIPYFAPAAMSVGPGLENNAFAVVSLLEDGTLRVEGYGRQESFTVRPS